MPPAFPFSSFTRLAIRAGERYRLGLGVLALLHLAAFFILLETEDDVVPRLIFLLTWGLLNFAWLLLLRRPAVAASLSLVMVVVLILLSRFKQDILLMSANFIDVMRGAATNAGCIALVGCRIDIAEYAAIVAVIVHDSLLHVSPWQGECHGGRMVLLTRETSEPDPRA